MRGYRENEEGDVVLTMSRQDFERVISLLATATGELACEMKGLDPIQKREAIQRVQRAIALTDRINAGNPRWRQYPISAEERLP
jgi:hypothetical protein